MNESPTTVVADIPATTTSTPQTAAAGLQPSWYYWIFAASGFAGLIYESLWARYLKLFLGHDRLRTNFGVGGVFVWLGRRRGFGG